MTATSTPFGSHFYQALVAQMFQTLDNGTKVAYHMLWDALISFLSQNLLLVIVVLILILVFAFARAFTGRWGMLGSVLYNYLYFGVLFIVGLIWGPEVFADDYFKIVLVILYVVCFLLVGQILRKIGVRRY